MSGRAHKGRYLRSSPVTRLRRNFEKMSAHARLGRERLRAWSSSGDARVSRLGALVAQIAEECSAALGLASDLAQSGFVPPRQPSTYQPRVGDRVRVGERHRARYQQLYERQLREDPGLLDDLVVRKVLSSGEVAVQRGRRTPLAARKSHLFPALGSRGAP